MAGFCSRSIFVCVLDFLVIDNTKSLLKSHLVNYLKKYITTIAIAAITDAVKNVKSVGLVFVFALRLLVLLLDQQKIISILPANIQSILLYLTDNLLFPFSPSPCKIHPETSPKARIRLPLSSFWFRYQWLMLQKCFYPLVLFNIVAPFAFN